MLISDYEFVLFSICAGSLHRGRNDSNSCVRSWKPLQRGRLGKGDVQSSFKPCRGLRRPLSSHPIFKPRAIRACHHSPQASLLFLSFRQMPYDPQRCSSQYVRNQCAHAREFDYAPHGIFCLCSTIFRQSDCRKRRPE